MPEQTIQDQPDLPAAQRAAAVLGADGTDDQGWYKVLLADVITDAELTARIDGIVGNTNWRTGVSASSFAFHFTAGVPGASVGANGDVALNTTDGIFYSKAAGAWTSQYTDQQGDAGTPGLTEAEVEALIQPWALADNDTAIPDSKNPGLVAKTADLVSEADARMWAQTPTAADGAFGSWGSGPTLTVAQASAINFHHETGSHVNGCRT